MDIFSWSAQRSEAANARYKLVFFVPPVNLQQCKIAIFAAGAGRYRNYSEVCFTTPGIGQFKPGNADKPHIGAVGKLEELEEVKCEIMCSDDVVTRRAVAALKRAHPYEEVAYEVYKLEDF